MGKIKEQDLLRQHFEQTNKPLDCLMSDEFPKKPFDLMTDMDNFIFNSIKK